MEIRKSSEFIHVIDRPSFVQYLFYCGWLIFELIFVMVYIVETRGDCYLFALSTSHGLFLFQLALLRKLLLFLTE